MRSSDRLLSESAGRVPSHVCHRLDAELLIGNGSMERLSFRCMLSFGRLALSVCVIGMVVGACSDSGSGVDNTASSSPISTQTSSIVATATPTTVPPEIPAIPLSSGVLDRSGFGVAAGYVEIPDGPTRFAIVPGLFATQDAGQSWIDISPGQQPAWASVSSIDFLDRTDGFVVLNDPGMQASLAATNDGGTSWTTVASFNSLFHAGDDVQLQFSDPQTGWMYRYVPPATGCAILEATADGGETWDMVNQCLPDAGEIRFDADGTGWLGGTPSFTNERVDSLHRTDDGGRTWTEIRVTLPDGHHPAAAIYGLPSLFGDRDLLAVTLLDGPIERVAIYSTANNGTTWDLITAVDTVARPLADRRDAAGVAFASDNTWWISVGGLTGAETTVTADGGTTWQTYREGPTGTVLEVQAFDDQTAWITTTEGLFSTFDGAQTWIRMQSELGAGRPSHLAKAP